MQKKLDEAVREAHDAGYEKLQTTEKDLKDMQENWQQAQDQKLVLEETNDKLTAEADELRQSASVAKQGQEGYQRIIEDMDHKIIEQGKKNQVLGMELNAYKNELMEFKDSEAKQQQFVVLKIGTLKNVLVTVSLYFYRFTDLLSETEEGVCGEDGK